MRKNKAAKDFLAPLAPFTDRLYALDLPYHQWIAGEGASGYPCQELADIAGSLNMKAQSSPSLEEAIDEISLKEDAIILITGSLLLAGDVLKKIEAEKDCG